MKNHAQRQIEKLKTVGCHIYDGDCDRTGDFRIRLSHKKSFIHINFSGKPTALVKSIRITNNSNYYRDIQLSLYLCEPAYNQFGMDPQYNTTGYFRYRYGIVEFPKELMFNSHIKYVQSLLVQITPSRIVRTSKPKKQLTHKQYLKKKKRLLELIENENKKYFIERKSRTRGKVTNTWYYIPQWYRQAIDRLEKVTQRYEHLNGK